MMLLVAFEHHAFAVQYKHLVLIRMAMPGCKPTPRDFKLAHGKIRRSFPLAEQPAHLAATRILHVHRLLLNLFVVVHFHRVAPSLCALPAVSSTRPSPSPRTWPTPRSPTL